MATTRTIVTTSSGSRPLYRVTQIVWYLLAILETLLGFRFFLKFFGANPVAGFTNFIYTVTYPFAEPFLAVFRSSRIEGRTFEWTTLLAMLVYWLIAWAIVWLLAMGRPVSDIEASQKLEEEERT